MCVRAHTCVYEGKAMAGEGFCVYEYMQRARTNCCTRFMEGDTGWKKMRYYYTYIGNYSGENQFSPKIRVNSTTSHSMDDSNSLS